MESVVAVLPPRKGGANDAAALVESAARPASAAKAAENADSATSPKTE